MITPLPACRPVLTGLLLAALFSYPHAAISQNLRSQQVFTEPAPPARDPERDLVMKITQPFSMVGLGDVMVKRTGIQLQAPEFQQVFDLIRGADVGIGNMEGNLADIPRFDGPLRGMMGDRHVAGELKAMGIDMMNRANNHIFDSDDDGMFSTIEQLEKAGIVQAGTGKNLEDARAPAYFDTPKGRVALIGVHSVHSTRRLEASPQTGNIGGRPGLNPLGTTIIHNVTREQLEQLKAMRRSTYTPPPGTTFTTRIPDDSDADRIQYLGNWYQVGTPGTKDFEMDQDDVDEIMRSIRNGKTLSDYLVVSIHSHQGPITAQQWLFEDQTPDFLVEFAHLAVDNGADAFIGHGPHVLRGVEIYNGKPIFYGLGEFFYQWQHMDASLMSGSWEAVGGNPDAPTDVAGRLSSNWRPINFESMIALSEYDRGHLAAVKLYPTHGDFSGPVSKLGLPRMAPPDMAQRILERVAELSRPLGTHIEIEDGVGIIRVNEQVVARNPL